MSLFGTDGIRSKAFEGPLELPFVFQIGLGIARYLQHENDHSPTVFIGRDTRYSGPVLQSQLITGLLADGIHVLDGQMLPTPVISVLTQQTKADLGIIISASHNPAEDNGIKLIQSDGKKLSPEIEEKIESFISQPSTPFSGNGTYEIFSKTHLYVQQILKQFSFPSFKVVLDCAHGAFSEIAPTVLKDLGLEMIPLFNQPDGKNINQNCGALHPEQIQQTVVEEKANMGICLDGDGDRVILIDEKGQIQDGDKVLALIGLALHEKNQLPHQTVVSTVMCNFGLKKFLESKQIQLLQTPVGDRNILVEMQKHGYALGGEPSGHLIFQDHPSQTGDGLFSGLKVLERMAETQKPLSELAAVMTPSPQILLNVRVQKKIPLETIPAFQDALKETEESLAERGRVLVRYSGTENLLRIMVEGTDSQLIEKEALRLKNLATQVLST